MGKLRSSSLGAAIVYTLSVGAKCNPPIAGGIYDMKPKNSFRGGSRGKGGKIKYARK